MASLSELRKQLWATAYANGPAWYYLPAYRYIVNDIATTEGAWLDIGCGTGVLCVLAAAGNPGLDVIGIDTSPEMLKIAEQNKGSRLNITLRKMSGADIIYPQGTFNVITAIQSAHHWTDTAAVLKEAHRVLVPGGKLYIYEADPDGEVPKDWVRRRGFWPPDSIFKRRWRKWGMDQARWDALTAEVRQSPFGDSFSEERHGFYRRIVATRE